MHGSSSLSLILFAQIFRKCNIVLYFADACVISPLTVTDQKHLLSESQNFKRLVGVIHSDFVACSSARASLLATNFHGL